MHSLAVALGFPVEHAVLVSWQHFGLGGHLILPSLDQLNCACSSCLITQQPSRSVGQAAAENLSLARSATMPSLVEGLIGFAVQEPLSFSCSRKFFGCSTGGARLGRGSLGDCSCDGEGRLRLFL